MLLSQLTGTAPVAGWIVCCWLLIISRSYGRKLPVVADLTLNCCEPGSVPLKPGRLVTFRRLCMKNFARCWAAVPVPNNPNGLGEWLNGPNNGAFFLCQAVGHEWIGCGLHEQPVL